MPDRPAFGEFYSGLKKTNDAGTGPLPAWGNSARHFLLRHLTETMDAWMPKALVSSMPMYSLQPLDWPLWWEGGWQCTSDSDPLLCIVSPLQRHPPPAVCTRQHPQSNQSAGPIRFLIFVSISILLLASLVTGRRPQCTAGAD